VQFLNPRILALYMADIWCLPAKQWSLNTVSFTGEQTFEISHVGFAQGVFYVFCISLYSIHLSPLACIDDLLIHTCLHSGCAGVCEGSCRDGTV
jgi:hypothetical protein